MVYLAKRVILHSTGEELSYLRSKQESFVPGRKCRFLLIVNFQTNCVTFVLHGLYAGPLHKTILSCKILFSFGSRVCYISVLFLLCLHTCAIDCAFFLLVWSRWELWELISDTEPGMLNLRVVVKRKWGHTSPDCFHATLSFINIKTLQFSGDGRTLR